MPLSPGEPAPWFTAPSASSDEFTFNSVAGRYILLAFLPEAAPARAEALQRVAEHRALFDDVRCSAFMVLHDSRAPDGARDVRGLRWFLDPDGAVARLYDAILPDGSVRANWILLDPALRVLAWTPIDQAKPIFDLIGRLPMPGDHAGAPLHAPVLIAPRVFDPDLCSRLIALHQAKGGSFTGVMRDVGGRTVAVMDDDKRRRDVLVEDPGLREEIRHALTSRLFPQIRHGMQFTVTEIERYLIGCYAADDGGLFRAHRDNVTLQTANRKFACSLNLNDDFEGGDLRFPEFGPATYRPPLGGAIVFSCTLLHEALPMRAGRRYAFLPFFYDEDGARTLEAYLESQRAAADPIG
jgi:peroxiredoxin/predicted 2-oxoglutarate/Fe(II)-dependent dioxygenase YbiX